MSAAVVHAAILGSILGKVEVLLQHEFAAYQSDRIFECVSHSMGFVSFSRQDIVIQRDKKESHTKFRVCHNVLMSAAVTQAVVSCLILDNVEIIAQQETKR